jgi:hypothetical protein
MGENDRGSFQNAVKIIRKYKQYAAMLLAMTFIIEAFRTKDWTLGYITISNLCHFN